MSESQKAARFNITIPPGLKARMEEAPLSVNWSAVAARAFEVKLLELESLKEGKTMDGVISRLKAADDLDQNEQYQEGHKAGVAWARLSARPKQLRALGKTLQDSSESLEDSLEIACMPCNKGIGYHLYFDIHPRRSGEVDTGEIEAFWVKALGYDGVEMIEDRDFARGFVEGALELWEKVRDRV